MARVRIDQKTQLLDGFEEMIKLPDKPLAYWVRWFCLPAVVFAVFVFLGLALWSLNSLMHVWFEPAGGFLLALIWVLSAHLIAPDRKPIASTIAFGVGLMLAWKLIGHSWYPEHHPKAYQPTHIPIVMTIAGGFLGLAGSLIMGVMKRNPNHVLEATSKSLPRQ